MCAHFDAYRYGSAMDCDSNIFNSSNILWFAQDRSLRASTAAITCNAAAHLLVWSACTM